MCLLAAMIRDLVDVKIIDAQLYNLSVEDFKETVRVYQPDIVGISLLSSEYADMGNTTADAVKEVSKDIITIAGGVHVTTMYWKVMENQNIDYSLYGEGEYILPAFIKYLNGEGEYPTEGLIRRKPGGGLEVLPKAIVQDLDALPLPAYDLLDYAKYSMTIQRYGVDAPSRLPFARFPTSRGCPVGCTFCQVPSISGKRIRLRSAEKVVEELEYLKKNYGIKAFHFEDDNAFFYRDRTKRLMELMIERNLNLKWKATGVFLPMLDDELLGLMEKAGCELINIAIESGTERVLKKVIKKPIDLKRAPEKIAMIKKHGIYVVSNFIIGLPSETWDEIMETLHYAETCGADYVKFFLAIPLVGTEMHEMAEKMGVIVGDETMVSQRYSVMQGPDYDPKDLNALRVYEWDRINFADPAKRERAAKMMNLSVEELNAIRRETRKALSVGEQEVIPVTSAL